MPQITIPIRGMHCKSCEILVEKSLKNIPGVKNVDVNYRNGIARVSFEGQQPSADVIKQKIADAGYQVGEKEKLPWLSQDPADYKNLFWAGAIILILYYFAKSIGLFNLDVATDNASLFVVLLVGLVAGVSTCMALVGGLVLGMSARHAELHPEATAMQKFRPHLYFNLGRILGYAVLGGIIGLVGSALKPSAQFLGLLTVVVGLVMIFLGLKLVEIFPALRDKTITLPKGLAKLLKINQENREYSHRSTMLTGALTFFLPCGFTQAMQLYAVSTGSFTQGFLIMGLFALGTAPGLLSVGGLSSVFKGKKARLFFAAAGVAVIMLGWLNVANGRHLAFQGRVDAPNPSGNGQTTTGEVQEVRMTQNSYGYSPNQFVVEKGKRVKWIITSTNNFSCASSLVMPKYGISRDLQKGENIIEFTPTQTGEIPFSCSMGMYRGKFIVVDDKGSVSLGGVDTVLAASESPTASGSSCGGAGGGCGGCGMAMMKQTK